MSSSSASHSVSADAGDREDFREEDADDVVDAVDNCDEDFLEIITRGKWFFLLLRPGPVVATLLAAKHSCCRKGWCIDASLRG